jgi:hypothetical protein
MDAGSHKAITLAVASALGIEDSRSRKIAQAATTPDLMPDYAVKTYVTRTGKIRTRRVRATHHGAPLSLLKKNAVKARHLWLEGRKDEADYMVGRLLHYLQDGSIPSPKMNKTLHDNLERECSRLDPESFMEEAEKFTPVGKTETFKVLFNEKVASTPEGAMKEALKSSFSVASSIFSSIFPPPKFSSLGREAYNFFKSRSKELFLYSLLWICLLIPLCIGVASHAEFIILPPVGLFTAFLAGVIVYNGICMLIVALSKNMNQVLYKIRWIHRWILPNSVLTILAVLYHVIIPMMAIPVVLLVYFRFLASPAWKAIKEEVDWYRWK